MSLAILRIVALAAALGLALATAALLVEPAKPGLVPGGANGLAELPESDAAPWTVLLLTDLQDGFHYLPALLREGARLDPSAIILLGDLSRRPDRSHMDLVARELQRHPVPAPLFAVPGNHDVGPQGRAVFAERLGTATFSFHIGRTRFIGVDDADGHVEDSARLEDELKGARRRGERVVLAMHRGESLPGDERPARLPADPALLALLRDYDVDLVLCGHGHEPHYVESDGTAYLVAPASGDRSFETEQTPPSFLALHWTGSGFEIEQHRVPRLNRTELESLFLHLSLSHVRPFVLAHGVVPVGLAGFLALYGFAEWATLRSRGRIPGANPLANRIP